MGKRNKKQKCEKACNSSMWEKLKSKALCAYGRGMLFVYAFLGY